MFTAEADVRFLALATGVVLLAPLEWREGANVITVPAHFYSDGASVPRLAWWLVGHPFERRLRRAAILHDYECVVREGRSTDAHARFRRALRADGCAPWRAWALWAVVRVVGPRWGS